MAKKSLFSWSKFWTNNFISATIEDAAKDDVVLTFDTIRPFGKALATDFSIAGKTISGIVLDSATNTITVTVTVAFVHADAPSIIYNPRDKGYSKTQVITNNIA
jgi:hypothetical protein